MGCISGCTQGFNDDIVTLHIGAKQKIKKLHWLFYCGLSGATGKKKKAANTSPTSPRYVVSIQLPRYTSSRHKATIVLIVFWDKYSSNCPFSFKSVFNTTYY